MSYTQLTQEQRYQIYALHKARFNQTQIATEIGVHKATVSREVRRGRGERGYRPKQAQALALARLSRRVKPRIASQTWQQVTQLLGQQWSPAQISGRLRLEGHPTVSHERIYQYIYADKRAGGTLHLNLRLQKQRRKRYGSYARRGQLPNRRSIAERPKIVDRKARRGDWEADTIIGRNHQAAIVSLVDRKSKLVRGAFVARNTAKLVGRVITTQLQPLPVKTITSGSTRTSCLALATSIATRMRGVAVECESVMLGSPSFSVLSAETPYAREN